MRVISICNILFFVESCGSVQLALAATGHVDERRMIQATGGRSDDKKASFEFTDIMPGKYRGKYADFKYITSMLDRTYN